MAVAHQLGRPGGPPVLHGDASTAATGWRRPTEVRHHDRPDSSALPWLLVSTTAGVWYAGRERDISGGRCFIAVSGCNCWTGIGNWMPARRTSCHATGAKRRLFILAAGHGCLQLIHRRLAGLRRFQRPVVLHLAASGVGHVPRCSRRGAVRPEYEEAVEVFGDHRSSAATPARRPLTTDLAPSS